jgi:outer membrane protein assembly factor BamB
MSRHREVVALDRRTGRERWRRVTSQPGESPSGSLVLTSGGDVLVGDYDVVALDGDSGVIRWRFSPADGYGPGIYLGTVEDGTAYAGSPSGHLYAIDAATGRLRWSVSLGEGGAATVYTPIVHGDLAIAGFTEFGSSPAGGVIAVDVGTGVERWRTRFPKMQGQNRVTRWAGGPVIWEDVVVAASATGTIYGMSLEGGRMRFDIQPEQEGSAWADQDFRALAVLRNRLVAGSLSGDVVAYARAGQPPLWRYTAPALGSVAFAISVDRDRLYVPYAGGRLVTLDGTTGSELWRTDRPQGVFAWPPVADDEHVYAAGERSVSAWLR